MPIASNGPHDASSTATSNDLPVLPPEEPRLTIQHLMVWAVCVAGYLSAFQTIVRLLELSPTGGVETAWRAVAGVAQGTGLAGLLLLVVRRARGLKFPRHGGEMLWIIVGTQACMRLLRFPIYFLGSSEWIGTALSIYGLLNLAVWAAVYLYAILQAETRRWRAVFVLMVATAIAVPVLTTLAVRFNGVVAMATVSLTIQVSQQLIVVASVLFAAWIDLRQSRRYPWTHWTGIILYFLQFAGTVLWFVSVLIVNYRQA